MKKIMLNESQLRLIIEGGRKRYVVNLDVELPNGGRTAAKISPKEFEEKIQENTPEKAKKLKELTGIDTLTASIFCTEIVMSDLLKFLILSVTFFQTKCQFIKKTSPQRGCLFWRPGSESNRHTRICSPLHNHSATRPRATILGKK